MNKLKFVPIFICLVPLSGCVNESSYEEVISLYSSSSRFYVNSYDEKGSSLLKTYHHKKFGDIPYVRLDEYCNCFPLTSINGERDYFIKDNKFVVTYDDLGSYIFDAKTDKVTTTRDILYFFKDSRVVNNLVPYDIYVPSNFERFTKGSNLSSFISRGSSRTYDCKKYNFDIVYEKGIYYAPFSLLTKLFFEHGNETAIYNGMDYFDVDQLVAENPLTQYCYSSKGNFLLDLSGGQLGPLVFNMKSPVGEEEYHFETVIEASGQKFVFSLKNGSGFITSYDKDGKEIEEDTFKKVTYQKKGNVLEMKYFIVYDKDDDESKAISDIYLLPVHLDETYFLKGNRSKEVAEFSYQELRFAMYELYGKTKNTVVKDFDNFIKDKDYRNDLFSLDINKYDSAMAKFLIEGIDDGHTSIETTSIYGTPTLANKNQYATTYFGQRTENVLNTISSLREKRSKAGISKGTEIVGDTAYITFDKFEFTRNKNNVVSLKAYKEYENTEPKDYLDNTMEFFASSFNMIEKDLGVKNVVIDLSCNSGGKTATVAYLLSYLTNDPQVTVNRMLNDSILNFHYVTDLDQDGVYGSDKDTFRGKYNFYILTSGGSFSCGNHLPQICKENGLAKIIGQTSGGGSCSISQISTSSGFIYCGSSENVAVNKSGESYVHADNGVSPDIIISEEDFYNRNKINELLK